MLSNKTNRSLFIIFIILYVFLDFIMTYIGIKFLGGYELNPFARFIMSQGSIYLFLFKLSAIAVVSNGLSFIHFHLPKISTYLLIIIVVMSIIIVVFNSISVIYYLEKLGINLLQFFFQ
ncbi:MAG: DUF5658 family protein [Methanosarcinales archaeon]